MKHTPGPWKILYGYNVVGPNDRGVASAGSYTNNVDGGIHIWENEANARLIAAAPELLEACIEAEGWIAEHGPGMEELLIQLETAITKATEQATA